MTKIAQLTDRAVLRIAGADARPFLQGLLTNDIDRLAPDKPLWAGFLSPQGKYLYDMILFDPGEDGLLADVEAARADELLKRLTMYRLRRDVTIERSEQHVYVAWDGTVADAPADPRLSDLGQRWIAASADTNATAEDYDRHRLLLGIPDGSRDLVVDKLMWLESNAVELNGVSFAKGCYVGQENTARMHHRDRLRKRLLPVRFEGTGISDPTIRAGEREAGELRSHRDGMGVAYLRLEHIGDQQLMLGDRPVTVEWPQWLPRD